MQLKTLHCSKQHCIAHKNTNTKYFFQYFTVKIESAFIPYSTLNYRKGKDKGGLASLIHLEELMDVHEIRILHINPFVI